MPGMTVGTGPAIRGQDQLIPIAVVTGWGGAVVQTNRRKPESMGRDETIHR